MAAPPAKVAAEASAAWMGRALDLRQTQLVAGVGRESIAFHELIGHLLRQGRIEPSLHVDPRELPALGPFVGLQFGALALEVGFSPCPPAS